jgi:hypothetical protein
LDIPIQSPVIARAVAICADDLNLTTAVAHAGVDQRYVTAMRTDESDAH